MPTDTSAPTPSSPLRQSPPRFSRAAPATSAAAGSVAPVRSRRSWGYAAAAAAAIVAGGLLSFTLFQNAQHTVAVFVTARTIDRGATITSQDLTTLDVAAGQPAAGFTTAQASQLIGKTATVTMPKGSLVTRGAIASTLPVPAGHAVVGVALKPSEMPAASLQAGDRVVLTPVASQSATVQSAPAAGNVTATVVSTPATNASTGLTVVDVDVSEADAADLAGRAAAGLVALYLKSGTGA